MMLLLLFAFFHLTDQSAKDNPWRKKGRFQYRVHSIILAICNICALYIYILANLESLTDTDAWFVERRRRNFPPI
jgi:hypothetical protein